MQIYASVDTFLLSITKAKYFTTKLIFAELVCFFPCFILNKTCFLQYLASSDYFC